MEWIDQLLFFVALCASMLVLLLAGILFYWGTYWFQAFMCGADVSLRSLIVMSLLGIDRHAIVTGKIMGRQSGISIDRQSGMSTARLMAHYLAGGSVLNVVRAIIAAQRAGMDLDFDRAAAIDLSGRDVLQAVRTSVSPQVISCPRQDGPGRKSLSAVARNGVEVLVGVKVTVRTNLDQLIGGATEETIIARVGQAIIAAVGTANSHKEVMEVPSDISKRAMAHGLDANTAFSIISIDVSDIELGENIGARLQTLQAAADTKVAQAAAEARRSEAIARMQQMQAEIGAAEARRVLAEALLPSALAVAFRAGQLRLGPQRVNVSQQQRMSRHSTPEACKVLLGPIESPRPNL